LNIKKKDLQWETMRGRGAGGQHKNKTDSCVRVTHIPTGTQVTIDGRKQGRNKKRALYILKQKLVEAKTNEKAEEKKGRRDRVIHERNIVRTYDFSRGVVKDHRTGKTASLKQVLEKGRLDLLHPDKDGSI
jgi:peptide chain release factor 1